MSNDKSYELEGFIMMSVHVPGEEVEDGHIHEVEQSTPGVIWRSGANLEGNKIFGSHNNGVRPQQSFIKFI